MNTLPPNCETSVAIAFCAPSAPLAPGGIATAMSKGAIATKPTKLTPSKAVPVWAV
ncbi:MAG: hypothetical protein U1E16_01305 [Hyphomicrobiales bacterium]